MIKRFRLGSVVGLLVLLLPALGESAPARVIVRGASRPARELTSPPVSPSPRPLRSFNDDIYAPGAVRKELRPMSRILEAKRSQEKNILTPAAPRPAASARVKTVRTMRQAIIRVDFSRDGAGNQTTGDGRFDLRRNVTGIPVDPPPHNKPFLEAHAEALRRFYDVESYGTLNVESTVFPTDPDSAYHLDDTADYGPWEVSQNPDVAALAEKFVTAALKAADRSGEIDFASFDAFAIVHAGADFQGDINGDTPFDIPSFALTLSESLAVAGGTVKIGRALVLPETGSQDDRVAALNGVFAHEFGHILGLPDLYNIFNGVPQLGYWSLMDSGENLTVQVEDPTSGDVFYADGVFPTSLDPWSRLQVFPDAVKTLVVEEGWQGSLQAIEADSLLPMTFIGPAYTGLEYFLAENRALDLDGNGFPFVQQDSTTGVFLGPVDDPDRPGTGGHLEYDAVLPGGGLLLWHIDDRYAVPGFISGAVNFQTGARGIALEEADGIWDMGRFNFGTPYDPFYVGNNAKFGPDTVPSSAANDGAYSGVTIETTSGPGRFMDVSITRATAVAGWPVPFTDDASIHQVLGPVTTVDLTGDLIPEILFGADGSLPNVPTVRRTIVSVAIDPSQPFLYADSLSSRVLPGLAASNAFMPTSGAPPQSVVAAALNSGRVYLWDKNQNDLLPGGISVGAATPPVIWDAPSGPDAVLVGGVGTLVTITVPGGARTDSAEAAGGERPTAGPTLLTQSGEEWGAVGYANGSIETFSLLGSATRPAPFHMNGVPLYLMSGHVDPLGSEASLVAVSAESVIVFSAFNGRRSAAWALDHPSAVDPALADVDGDGFSEVAIADTTGRVMIWNGDGSPALGWPKQVPKPAKDLKVLDLDQDGGVDVLVLDGNGRFYGWNGRGTLLPTYPRALDPFDPVSSVVEAFNDHTADPDSYSWVWIGTGKDLVTGLPTATALRVGIGQSGDKDWRYAGQNRERSHRQSLPAGGAIAGEPVLDHPLLVYPNPAREWVELRFLLDPGETADLEVLDLSGKIIDDAHLDRRGGFRTGENAVRWDLTDMAPGLYFCRLERSGSSAGSKVDMARVVVLR